MSQDSEDEADYIARAIRQALVGHMEERTCTAKEPMPLGDKDKYWWHHPDAKVVDSITFGNTINLWHCPHCDFKFTAFPRTN
jgi:hypothetical protein